LALIKSTGNDQGFHDAEEISFSSDDESHVLRPDHP
jgi:hypothetical protein